MAIYSSWGKIFWSIFDACYTFEHPFFSGFEAEKGLHVIHAVQHLTVLFSPVMDSEWFLVNVVNSFLGFSVIGFKL